MKGELLQISPLHPFLEAGLRERFQVHRWFEMEQPETWLSAHAGAIRAAVTNGSLGVPDRLLLQLPALGLIAISGVGYDKVNVQLAQSRGIRVTNTPDVLTDDSADLAVGLIFSLLRGIAAADRFVRDGRWLAENFPLSRKVTGCRFGIIGMGRIGQAIAARLSCLGPVAYSAPRQKAVPYAYFGDPVELARTSDVLVLAAIANASTRHLVGRALLDALGPRGYLINVARGSLLDEPELVAALLEGRIGGAALDVFADEPQVPAVLRTLPNVVLTPHIGTATHETRQNMGRMVLASLDAWFAGASPPNAVV